MGGCWWQEQTVQLSNAGEQPVTATVRGDNHRSRKVVILIYMLAWRYSMCLHLNSPTKVSFFRVRFWNPKISVIITIKLHTPGRRSYINSSLLSPGQHSTAHGLANGDWAQTFLRRWHFQFLHSRLYFLPSKTKNMLLCSVVQAPRKAGWVCRPLGLGSVSGALSLLQVPTLLPNTQSALSEETLEHSLSPKGCDFEVDTKSFTSQQKKLPRMFAKWPWT